MEQVDIIEDSHLPAAQVVTIVLPSIPHEETATDTYGSSQQETVPIDSHQLPLASTTIQLTQVQSAVPLAVLKEDPNDSPDNQNLVVVATHHDEAATVAAALGHQPNSPAHHQEPYNHHHHHHHHHSHHHQQQNHHNNDEQIQDHDDDNHHHHLQPKQGGGGASTKSRTRFKWTKESAQVALNLVKHGCKPVLVSVAVGCSLRTAQKFVEIVKPKMEGEAFKDYEIKRRGRKSRDVNQRLEAIREVLSKDVSKTQVQIAADLKVSNTTVCRDIKRIGASWKRTEASASATGAATSDQNTPSRGEPSSKRLQPTTTNSRSTRSGGFSQRQRRNTSGSIAVNNNDIQSDATNNATGTITNNSATTTSSTTGNAAPKHELAQQVHA